MEDNKERVILPTLEVKSTIKRMKNKAPCIDGLPTELLNFFHIIDPSFSGSTSQCKSFVSDPLILQVCLCQYTPCIYSNHICVNIILFTLTYSSHCPWALDSLSGYFVCRFLNIYIFYMVEFLASCSLLAYCFLGFQPCKYSICILS